MSAKCLPSKHRDLDFITRNPNYETQVWQHMPGIPEEVEEAGAYLGLDDQSVWPTWQVLGKYLVSKKKVDLA